MIRLLSRAHSSFPYLHGLPARPIKSLQARAMGDKRASPDAPPNVVKLQASVIPWPYLQALLELIFDLKPSSGRSRLLCVRCW